jgi:hypothetical protein
LDAVWHEAVLNTRYYAALRQRVCGHFVHHSTESDPGAAQPRRCHSHCHIREEPGKACGLTMTFPTKGAVLSPSNHGLWQRHHMHWAQSYNHHSEDQGSYAEKDSIATNLIYAGRSWKIHQRVQNDDIIHLNERLTVLNSGKSENSGLVFIKKQHTQ